MTSVLIIDDEAAIRESIGQVLTRAGFQVATADDGLAGVEGCLRQSFDVVIVDIVMPGSDGIAVIRKLRANHPRARILAMTGGGNFWPMGYKPGTVVTDAYLALASQSGADALMQKPFKRQALIESIRALAKS